MLAPSQHSQEGAIRSLDGVRGLAVLMVLLDHAGDEGMYLFTGADVNRVGKYGVYLFFVLSAFLLTYPFLGRTCQELREPRLWGNYFLRRVLRIFPLYVVVLLFFTLSGRLDWGQFGDHLLLRDGRWHLWTVPVEFKFYFALPFVALAFAFALRKQWRVAILTALALWMALEWAFFPLEELWSIEGDIRLKRSIETFLMGSLASVIYWLTMRRPPGLHFRPWLEAIAAVCIVAIFLRIPAVYQFVVPGAGDVKGFDDDHVFCGFVWSLFLVCYLNGTGLIRRALEWAPFCYLGLVSYSAYLWHRPVLQRVDDLPISSLAQLFLSLAVVVAIATVTYLLIERPLSRIRLAPKRPPAEPPTPARTADSGDGQELLRRIAG